MDARQWLLRGVHHRALDAPVGLQLGDEVEALAVQHADAAARPLLEAPGPHRHRVHPRRERARLEPAIRSGDGAGDLGRVFIEAEGERAR